MIYRMSFLQHGGRRQRAIIIRLSGPRVDDPRILLVPFGGLGGFKDWEGYSRFGPSSFRGVPGRLSPALTTVVSNQHHVGNRLFRLTAALKLKIWIDLSRRLLHHSLFVYCHGCGYPMPSLLRRREPHYLWICNYLAPLCDPIRMLERIFVCRKRYVDLSCDGDLFFYQRS